MVVFWTVQSSLRFLPDSLIVQQEYFLTAEFIWQACISSQLNHSAKVYFLTAELLVWSAHVHPDRIKMEKNSVFCTEFMISSYVLIHVFFGR